VIGRNPVVIAARARYSARLPKKRRETVLNGSLLGANQPTDLDEATAWQAVAASLSHLKISPFEAKALYVFPVMRQLAEGSMILLNRGLHLPAFVTLADAIEAFGRCVRGCQLEGTGSGNRLQDGLRRLQLRDDGEFRTMSGLYQVPEIVAMRNFTTHGATTPKRNGLLDCHLSVMLVNRFGEELTDYWLRLGRDGSPERDAFAAARVRPLYTGGVPVFVEDMFNMMSEPGATAGQGIHARLT
jgi:hypothetical protein